MSHLYACAPATTFRQAARRRPRSFRAADGSENRGHSDAVLCGIGQPLGVINEGFRLEYGISPRRHPTGPNPNPPSSSPSPRPTDSATEPPSNTANTPSASASNSSSTLSSFSPVPSTHSAVTLSSSVDSGSIRSSRSSSTLSSSSPVPSTHSAVTLSSSVDSGSIRSSRASSSRALSTSASALSSPAASSTVSSLASSEGLSSIFPYSPPSSSPSLPAPSPFLSTSSSSPVSASSTFKYGPVLAGIIVTLFFIAVVVGILLRRRSRLQKEHGEIRVYRYSAEDWERRMSSIPASVARGTPGPVGDSPGPMDSPWNGSDVLLLGPGEWSSYTPSMHSPSSSPDKNEELVQNEEPGGNGEPSKDEQSDGRDAPEAATPASNSFSMSRAPTFVTVDDRTPPTPPPHYSRPLPDIPFCYAY